MTLLHFFCALLKRGEWKRAGNSNLLLCLSVRWREENRRWKFEICVLDGFKGSIICSWVFLENRGEIICCLCSLLCLCLLACFPCYPLRTATQKHKYVCSSSALSTKQLCVFVWASGIATVLYICVYVNARWSKWLLLFVFSTLCVAHIPKPIQSYSRCKSSWICHKYLVWNIEAAVFCSFSKD